MVRGKVSTILLIEDSRVVQKLYSQKFSLERYRVLVAGDGLEALRTLATETPDLILLDLVIPLVDGYEILEVVRREHRLKDIPVIVFSGRSQGAELQRALDRGATDYIVKPTTPPNEVVQRVRRILEGKAANGRFRLRVDPAALDAARLAETLDRPGLRCTCSGDLALGLTRDAEGGLHLMDVTCNSCGKSYFEKPAQRLAG